MGWRFRRRVTLFPGVRINLSCRGISTTFGVPGASINVGGQGAYLNTGLPGTGIYSRTRLDTNSRPASSQEIPSEVPQPNPPSYFLPSEIGAIRSREINSITSEGFKGVKQTLLEALQQKRSLEAEVKLGEEALRKAKRSLRFILIISFHGRIFKKILLERQKEFAECDASLKDAQRQLGECNVSIEVEFDPILAPLYHEIRRNFERLLTSEVCWDVTESVEVDRVKKRSSAGISIARKQVAVNKASLSFVNSEHLAFHFVNANGADLYLFPAFLLAFNLDNDFALVDYHDLLVEYSNVRFVEEEKVPTDSQVMRHTWKYVNKDGSRDCRFSNNYQIPIVIYGEIQFTSPQGLNEAYEFSNAESARTFVESIKEYKRAMAYLQKGK